MTPGIHAQERPLFSPGKTATRMNVSPKPRKKNPPVSTPETLSREETTPSVNKTPAGMIAHQRSVPVKYTHQNPRLIPAKNTSPSKDSKESGRKDDRARPSNVNAGNAAHQFSRSLMSM